jgi:transcriptional regulator with XRE-family HTH domain
MPPKVRRSLIKFGGDIAIARKKRGLTVKMMTERLGIAQSTYVRVEKGDLSVTMGTYAMVLAVLGLGEMFGDLIDPGRDEQGLLLDLERLPKRVRVRKTQRSL